MLFVVAAPPEGPPASSGAVLGVVSGPPPVQGVPCYSVWLLQPLVLVCLSVRARCLSESVPLLSFFSVPHVSAVRRPFPPCLTEAQ